MNSETPLRPWWLRALALAAVALATSLFTWWPAIQLYPNTQGGDGQYFTRVMDIAHVTMERFHELPLWNAYECGGVPLWDNPEMPVASPLVFLTLGMSATKTMIVWYVVHAALGFVGMWLFVRDELQLTRMASLIASCLWAYGVGHTHQYAGGHAALTTFLFLPFAFLFWRRAEKDVDYAVALGLLFAWMMLEGGAYPMVHISLLLAVETLIRGLNPKRLPRIAAMGMIAVLVTVCVSAVRLLPVLDQIRSHERELGVETDFVTWDFLKAMFRDRDHTWYTEGQTYVWAEYTTYTGLVPLFLALIGIAIAGGETLWMLIVGAFCLALMLGHRSDYWPWAYLKGHVFPFKAMRVPSRFRLSFIFFIAAYLGLAVDRLPQLLKIAPRTRHLAVPTWTFLVGVAFLAVGDVVGLSSNIVAVKFNAPAEVEVEPEERFWLEGPKTASWLDQPRQNRGRIGCQDSWPFTEGAPLWVGDLPQAKPTNDAVTVTEITRTPNTMRFLADSRRYGHILINLPYEKGWRTNIGRLVEDNKLLMLEIPTGKYVVRLRYWPWGLTTGMWLSGVGFTLSILFLARRRVWSGVQWGLERVRARRAKRAVADAAPQTAPKDDEPGA